MLFSELARAFSEIEKTAGRLDMTDQLSSLFKKADEKQIDKTIYLCQGTLAPSHMGIDLGVGEKFAIEAIALSSGYERKKIERMYKEEGDLGLVAEKMAGNKRQMSLSGEKLTVAKVYDSLMKIAKSSGTGSQDVKIKLLADMLNSANATEAKYVVRLVLGKLRLGIGDPTILDSLSVMESGDKSLRVKIERAYNLCSDLGLVAKKFVANPKAIEKFEITPFSPIRPALAERLPTSEEIIEKIGKCAVEGKYDGLRMQVHKKGGRIEIFSRKLEVMTKMFPEIVQAVAGLGAKEIIFEGEALGYELKSGKYLSFQQTIQRKRKYGVEAMSKESPLRLFAFDLLFLEGKDYTTELYEKRRKELERVVKKGKNETVAVTEQIITEKPAELERFFQKCIAAGLEGVIAKDLGAPYVTGARKFAWIKLKRSYGALADTIDAVVCGYYLGKGARTEFDFGGLLVAVYNDELDRFETIARVGSGFSEEEMGDVEKLLSKIKLKEKPKGLQSKVKPDFWTELKYVVSVTADEITLSPMHTAGMVGETGYALRFPRMVAVREDKGPKEATTVNEIIELFEMQKRKR
jgi:DNA ligase-1